MLIMCVDIPQSISDLVKHYAENDTAEVPCKLMGATFPSAEELKEIKKLQKMKAKTTKSTRAPAATLKRNKGGPGSVWKMQDVCDWLVKSMDMPE
jgi:hypothetical protein